MFPSYSPPNIHFLCPQPNYLYIGLHVDVLFDPSQRAFGQQHGSPAPRLPHPLYIAGRCAVMRAGVCRGDIIST